MANNALKVLITRPAGKAQALTLLIKQQGFFAVSQPLFDYQAYATSAEIKSTIDTANIIIFVSAAAVEFAHARYPLSLHPKTLIIAIGQATKAALHSIGHSEVLTPSQENSEGVLSLIPLSQVQDKHIAIVRGNGGRELLASTLKQRGATVSYIESYQRLWRPLAKNIAQQWQQQQINCIVVTSNDILLTLIRLVTDSSLTRLEQHYWLNTCYWLVASQRIAKTATTMGLLQVINMNGASDTVIEEQLRKLSMP